jgi:hypothetical protein
MVISLKSRKRYVLQSGQQGILLLLLHKTCNPVRGQKTFSDAGAQVIAFNIKFNNNLSKESHQ